MAIRTRTRWLGLVAGLLSALAAISAHAARPGILGEGPLLACYPGNNLDLSSTGCPCASNNECITTCNGSTLTCGGVTGATLCSAGNGVNASANGCACSSDNECVGNCNQTTHTCGGVTNAPVCSIGNSIDASADGCPCSSNNQCQGVCVLSTNTCGGAVAQVNNTVPQLAAAASVSVVQLGAPVSDMATLAGGLHPAGSVTFRLYPPSAPDCSGAPVHTAQATVSGNGGYASSPFMTAQNGRYRWVARYNGDAYNQVVTTSCDDTAQHVYVGNELIFRNGFEAGPPQ